VIGACRQADPIQPCQQRIQQLGFTKLFLSDVAVDVAEDRHK